MYRVPAIITNQGPEVEELSIERRRLWISAISRADLTDKIVTRQILVLFGGFSKGTSLLFSRLSSV